MAIAIYTLRSHEKFGGYYDAWILAYGALFGVIAWRMWKNSRTWAVIGLVLVGLELVDKVQKAASTFGVITILLLVAFINAVRGAFAFHKYSADSGPLDAASHNTVAP